MATFLDRVQEAEEQFRHALTVVAFVEGEGEGENLERDINGALVYLLGSTDRDEETGPLIQRLRELAERAGALPLERVAALTLAVHFQVTRGDCLQACKELQVLPLTPSRIPPRAILGSWIPPLTSTTRPAPQWRTTPYCCALAQ